MSATLSVSYKDLPRNAFSEAVSRLILWEALCFVWSVFSSDKCAQDDQTRPIAWEVLLSLNLIITTELLTMISTLIIFSNIFELKHFQFPLQSFHTSVSHLTGHIWLFFVPNSSVSFESNWATDLGAECFHLSPKRHPLRGVFPSLGYFLAFSRVF